MERLMSDMSATYLIFVIVCSFLFGFVCGIAFIASYDKYNKEAVGKADPEIHVLDRRIYWLENIHSTYNQLKELFDFNPDKIECLELSFEDEPYNHNRLFCKYRSIGNLHRISIKNINDNDVGIPVVKLVKIDENPNKL